MKPQDTREVWQRGPIEGIPDLLQPVAHALLQALEETVRNTEDIPDALLWKKPGNVASVGFHLRHLRGVIDRLFTYARAESLTAEQLKALSEEQLPSDRDTVRGLVDAFHQQVQKAIAQLKETDKNTLMDGRTIGRKQIPTTVMGLLFHAAEHSQRHVGQLLVTIRIQTQS